MRKPYFFNPLLRFGFLILLCLVAACSQFAPDADGKAALATELLSQNRIAEARLAINDAIDARDDEPSFYLISAQIELRVGSNEGAYNAFQNALALDPANIQALLGVSQLGLQLGRLNDSQNAAERLLALQPQQTEALLVQGLIALVKRRYDEALRLADRVREISPGDEAGAILKARTLFVTGKADAAKKIMTDFEAGTGPTFGTARTRLEIARSQNDRPGLGSAFEELRTLTPDDFDLRLDEANFRFKTGGAAQAQDLLAEVVAAPNVGSEQLKQAGYLIREYSPSFSASQLSTIVSATPQARRTVAAAFLDIGQAAAARKVTDGFPDDSADGLRARVLLAEGQRAQAIELSRKTLHRDDTNCHSLLVLGQTAVDAGQYRQAIRSGQRASAECPDLFRAFHTTARAYAAEDDPFNARRVFREGTAENPQSAAAVQGFTEWLLDRGDVRPAIAAARSVARAAPASESAWRLFGDVCKKSAQSCAGEAGRGLAKARQSYWIDLAPGETPPNGLFGRLIVR